ncbi:MAG: triple tyrosine motif-containing protein [Bacteroidales bacterium]
MKRRNTLFASLLILSNLLSYATWNLSVKNFYKTENLSGAQNWSIKQQHNNWIYFANSYGLLEYDGSRWSVFPVANMSNVRAIEIDDKGVIYAGAYNEYGYYAPNQKGLLEYHSLSKSASNNVQSFGNVWQIHAVDGVVYFQTDYGIFKYQRGKAIKFIESKRKIDFSTSIKGTIYVTTDEGVMILNGENFFSLPNSGALTGQKICGIIPDGVNALIIATASNGLYYYSDRNLSPWKTGADNFLKNNTLFCMTGNATHLVLGSIQNGIVLMNRNGSVVQYLNNLSGLQNNTVLGALFDKNGDLWLALDKGISFVSISSPFSHLYGDINFYGSGYVSYLKRDILYLGTNQGLYYSQWPVGFSESLLKLKAIEEIRGQVWVINEIDGTLFCGTNSGAYIVNGTRVTKISSNPGFWLFQSWRGRKDIVLAGNYRGFWAIKKNGNSWSVSKIDGFEESARLFEQDNQGNVWMSHGVKGVYKLKFNNELTHTTAVEFFGKDRGFVDNLSISVFKIKDQILFTTLQGIYRYNSATKRMEPFDDLNSKLGGNMFYAKLITNPSNPDELWYIADRNLVIKNLRTGAYERYPLQNEMVYGFESVNIIDSKRAIIGDENGFNLFQRPVAKRATSYFYPAVRRVFITNPRDSLIYGQNYRTTEDAPVRIPYVNNSLRIECNANPFESGKKIAYTFKLEKYDVEWSKFSSSNSKEYTNLHEGSYVFKIKAVDVITGKTLTNEFQFTILPPWYRSTWMLIVYFLLILSLIYYVSKDLNKRLIRHQEKIEEEKNRQLDEQKAVFKQKTHEKEKEIIQLKADNLQNELKSKTQELANTVMNVVRKNEMLMEISSDLQKVSSAENMDVLSSRLRKLQNRIKNNIEHDDDWKKFEENFDSVHENFMKQLSDRFPNLTKSEKKLCAYLRMDLVSKDIAPLLNISVRGVEISRYRLRQKLELPRDVNLTDFLQRLQ